MGRKPLRPLRAESGRSLRVRTNGSYADKAYMISKWRTSASDPVRTFPCQCLEDHTVLGSTDYGLNAYRCSMPEGTVNSART
jgi:hypothetical protein